MISICTAVKNRSRCLIDPPIYAKTGIRTGTEWLMFPRAFASWAEDIRSRENCDEVVVLDYKSTDWDVPGYCHAISTDPRGYFRVAALQQEAGSFSYGGPLNIAANAALGDILMFLDADMEIPAGFLDSGEQVVRDGKVWFPLYQRERIPRDPEPYWGKGYGCMMISRLNFERCGGWPNTDTWGGADNAMVHAVQRAGLDIVRDRIPGFLHIWHPMTKEKRNAK